MKKKIIIIGAIILLLVVLVLLFIFNNTKKDNTETTTTITTTTVENTKIYYYENVDTLYSGENLDEENKSTTKLYLYPDGTFYIVEDYLDNQEYYFGHYKDNKLATETLYKTKDNCYKEELLDYEIETDDTGINLKLVFYEDNSLSTHLESKEEYEELPDIKNIITNTCN